MYVVSICKMSFRTPAPNSSRGRGATSRGGGSYYSNRGTWRGRGSSWVPGRGQWRGRGWYSQRGHDRGLSSSEGASGVQPPPKRPRTVQTTLINCPYKNWKLYLPNESEIIT